MGTKLATGLSKGENGAVAAKEAVLQAKKKLGKGRVDLSIVYSSSKYDYQEVVDAVRKATNNAPLVGASSAGEFTEERVEKGSVAVGLLSSDDIKIFTALAEGIKQDTEAAIKEIAAKLPGNVEDYPYFTVIFLIDGLAGVGEEIAILASYIFEQVFNRKIKLIGGCAGDDMRFEKTFVFSNDIVATNAASMCLLASRMPLFTAVKHGHTPMSKPLRVTKAKSNVVYEIDGRSAWEVWKEETAEAVKKRGIDIEKLDKSSLIELVLGNYELGLPSEKEGEYKIRLPLNINDDGSLSFSCGIAEGSVFRIMDGSDTNNQINAAGEAVRIARHSAENEGFLDFTGLLVFECGVRLMLLGDEFYKSVEQYKKALPDIPILGFETYGEIRMEPGQFSGFHNTTSVILLLPKVD
ncbi:FIST C-terminal domain-containing protein [candidate division WOR-3 bacterium]|nr:FIST C-terminal domain-containing protein [candidate division WOR-3 bacterium]MCK4528515.1 FIST C-terminal domain-containing protein [candidate division WOR-3 bacterium]